MTFAANTHPSEVAQTQTREVSNEGVTNPLVVQLAKALGLLRMPPSTLTLDALETYMLSYGPLWTNGKTHIVLLAGVNQGTGNVLVYDPAPVSMGKVEWRAYQWDL